MSSGFDRYASEYETLVDESIRFSGCDHAFFLEAKAELLLELAHALGEPARLHALDVGCGAGAMHPFLRAFGALHAVDPSAPLIEAAQAAHPDIRYAVADGTALPHEDGAFDLAFTVCVLHHVEPELRPAFTRELVRVVRPGGLVVVFEHNPLNPLTRLAVSRCTFDEGVRLLPRRETAALLRRAASDEPELGYLLFFPWQSGRLRRLERRLRRLPLGAQYWAAVRA